MENIDKPSKLPIIITSSLAILAIAAASAFGFLYFGEKNKPAEVVTQTVTKTKVEASSDIPATIELRDSKQAQEAYSAGKDDKSVKYSASVGKFSLSLPSSLGISQEMDGTGEGGSKTHLKIGKRTGSLITLSQFIPYTVEAIQIGEQVSGDIEKNTTTSTADKYKQYLEAYGVVTGDNPLDGSKESPEKIDDVDATGFTVDGLTAIKYVVTKKNGILYVLSYNSEDATNNEIAKLVTKGLKLQ
jgi:hypothetical protein